MRQPLSLKIGSRGLRGRVGESLKPQLITAFAAAFGTYCGAGPIVVGTDSRRSREMVKQAAISGLLSVGCTPLDAGVVPSPALHRHVRRAGAFGGILITASQSDEGWNGLRFIDSDGIALRENQAAELADLYHQGVYPRVAADAIPAVRTERGVLRQHREAVLELIDVDAIRARGFKVAIDPCNGAGSRATPAFLEALGCEVVELNTDPSEPFAHNPEPSPANLGPLSEAVRASGAAVGFGQDADADRLGLVDETGRPLGDDLTLALAVRHWLRRSPGPVVTTVATSRLIERIAAEHDAPVHRTRVGETHVIEGMREHGAAIGGEGNGGVIVPAVHPCRDGYVAMALILEAMAADEAPLSEVYDGLPRQATARRTLPCPRRETAAALRRLESHFAGEAMERVEGLTVLWDDRWLQVRAANSEPALRLTAEAPTEDQAAALLREAAERLRPSG